jgi:hypothetical protein
MRLGPISSPTFAAPTSRRLFCPTPTAAAPAYALRFAATRHEADEVATTWSGSAAGLPRSTTALLSAARLTSLPRTLRRLAHAQFCVRLVTDSRAKSAGPVLLVTTRPSVALEKIDVEALAFDALQHANFGTLAEARDRSHQN